MAIITYPLNGITYDASDAETYLCTRESGVFAGSYFAATITGAREITIGTGIAWVKNNNYKGKSIVSNEEVALSFSLADGSLPRIDRIVLRFDNVNRVSTLEVVTGTPAASPSAPAITRTNDIYELGLYEVLRPAGSVSITAENVTSTMYDEEICGIMRDGVTGIPTSELDNQWQAWFYSIRDTLDEDAATNLYNMIGNATALRTLSLSAQGWSESGGEYIQTQTPSGAQLSTTDNPVLVSLISYYPEWTTEQRKTYNKAFSKIALGSATINNDGSVTFKTYKHPRNTIRVGLKGV